MARRFRRTDEQLKKSVRGLSVSPIAGTEAAPPPPPVEAIQKTPARAPAAAPVRVLPDEPAKAKKERRLRRSKDVPTVERITPPRQVPPAFAESAPAGPPEYAPTEVIELAAVPAETAEVTSVAGLIKQLDEEAAAEALPTQEITAAAAPEAEGGPEPAPDVNGTAAVSARDAVKIYGEGANAVKAIDQVSHGFPKGRFTAIMGPSGSGKSTLLHCLAGLDDLTSGKVFIGKVDITVLDEKARTMLRRDKVGFIFQSFNLVPTLTALENITLPMELAKREPDQKWVNYLVQTVGLADRLDHLPTELSGGQQQRVAAVRALASKPDIVFADEPTGNLDSRRSTEILQFLRAAVDEFGQTIVMVTHDPIAASFADSIVFLADGRVVSEMVEPTVDRILDQIKTLEA